MRAIARKAPAFALAMLSACRGEPTASTAPATTTSVAASAAVSVGGAPPYPSIQPASGIHTKRWSPQAQALELDGVRDVHRLAFSDDGARVAASLETPAGDSWQTEIAVWSVEQGALLLRVVLPPDFHETGALAFARDGGLLAGERAWGSFVSHTYVRVSPSGQMGPVCEDRAPEVGRRPGPQPRGVGSLVELADGRVVTGGRDDSIAVWSATGCKATWLRGSKCGWAESIVQVARDSESSGFSTLGETSWTGQEDTPPLGVQRWRGPRWKREAVPMGAAAASSRGKEDLIETHLLSPNGQVVRLPSIDGHEGRSAAAVAPDGSCIGVASDRAVWIENVPNRRRRRIELPGKTSRLAVASRCAAVAAEIDHAVWLCREGACIPP